MRAIGLLVLLVLASWAAPAFAGKNEITYGASSRALRSSSADAVTADTLDGVGFTYARQLDVALMPKLTLWAVAGFSEGTASGTLFQTMHSDIRTTMLTAGGRVRYRPRQRIAVSGRLDVGSAWTSLTLSQGDITASDWAAGAVAVASGSLELLPLDSKRFGFGFRFEAGYVAASPVALTTTPEHDGDVLRLPTMQSETGHLDLTGPFIMFSLLGQL